MAIAKISTGMVLFSLSICFRAIDAFPVVNQSAIALRPLNKAVVAGQRARLSCAAGNESLATWTRTDAKGSWKQLTTLVSDCALNPLQKLAYGVEQDGNEGRCDLVVRNASVEDAAMYICSQCGGFEPAPSAQLAVLDSEPVCRIDKKEPQINDNVTLTCDVSYTDNISPMQMTWTDKQGRVIKSTIDEISAGRIQSNFTFTVPNEATLAQYTCTTAFSAPVGLPSTAVNTPELAFNWTSPALPVKGPMTCKNTALGTDYIGTQSLTVSGKTCQAWTSQSPHKHDRTNDSRFPDGSAALARNYCRNPDNYAHGPWCYTTDNATRWERCDIDFCVNRPMTCKNTALGTDYIGTQSLTVSGMTCQAWASQSPHKHCKTNDGSFPDGSVAQARNYCRNPDNDPVGPWCYTTDNVTRWERCDIDFCVNRPMTCRNTALGTDYIGTQSLTVSGKTCQAWTSQSPHKHDRTNDGRFPDGSAALASNYCRNPDNYAHGPWCYTTDPATRWERCDLGFCANSE